MNRHRYYDIYKRDKESQKFYRSKEWKDVRELALKRDNYLCQRCLSEKKIKRADLVHHIIPLKENNELRSVLSNLESICHRHHNEEHKASNDNNKPVKKNVNLIISKPNKEMPM